jgi:protease IV
MRIFFVLLIASFCAGCLPDSVLLTPVNRADDLGEVVIDGTGRSKIVVIPVDGMIANTKPLNPLSAGQNPLAVIEQQLRMAREDQAVRAVVLRINSPGGTVTGTETLHELIREFRDRSRKPVVASIQEVGASGGYHVALACDHVVACPSSIVGSIGVIFNAMNFEGTLQRVGVNNEAIKSGSLKDMASPFRSMTPTERSVIQGIVDENFSRFKSLVATRRNLAGTELDAVTDGRVFTGNQARLLGLVDDVGQLNHAIESARKLAGVASARVVAYRKPFANRQSVYADSDVGGPRALFELPESMTMPSGVYYLWRP